MNWLDVLILVLVLIPAALAVRHLWKRRGSGCCGNCACCPGCRGTAKEGKRHADAP